MMIPDTELNINNNYSKLENNNKVPYKCCIYTIFTIQLFILAILFGISPFLYINNYNLSNDLNKMSDNVYTICDILTHNNTNINTNMTCLLPD